MPSETQINTGSICGMELVRMKQSVREILPKWCSNWNVGASLMLGDDIDSLMTAMVLENEDGNSIDFFYDFEREYVVARGKPNHVERIGCDMALADGMCWDNHVTLLDEDDIYNVDSANLNNHFKINRNNYTSKYAGSTFLLVYSFYNIPLPETKEGKLILLAIDSAYLGHYNKRFKETHNEWLRKLGFEDLIEFLDSVEESEFKRVIGEYRLNEKIGLSGGKLVTNIDLKAIQEHFKFPVYLPKMKFKLVGEYKRAYMDLNKWDRKGKKPKKNERLVSFALTFKNSASYTIRNYQ
jgi:hypothetical protein